MPDDTGDKIAFALAKQGIEALPLGSLMLSVAQAFVPDNDKALQEALVQELLGDMHRLNARVDEVAARLEGMGKELDALGLLRTIAVFQEFLRAFSQSHGDEKREGLVNAAANQFDGTLGSRAFRERWFRIAAEMNDGQIAALKAFEKETNAILFDGSKHKFAVGEYDVIKRYADSRAIGNLPPMPLTDDDVTALREELMELHSRGFVRGFQRQTMVGEPRSAEWYDLSNTGRAILRITGSR